MEIHIKKGLDALQTETVLRLLSQTVWACNRKKEAIMESWKHSICYGAYTADGKQIGMEFQSFGLVDGEDAYADRKSVV